MKKSFMNNLKNFVDSNVRHRIDRVTHNSGNNSNSDPLSDDLLLVERHFDGLRQFCVDTEKKISNMLQSIQISSTTPSQLGAYTQNVQAGLNNLSHNIAQQAANITLSTSSNSTTLGTNVIAKSNDAKVTSTSSSESNIVSIPNAPAQYCPSDHSSVTYTNEKAISALAHHELNADLATKLEYDTLQKFRKLPIVGLYKSFCKSSENLKPDSLLATTLTHCSRMQAQLTNLYLIYEQMIDTQCLKPIQQMLEVDIPNVLKLKKLCMKAHYDLESARAKFITASQKQQQQQQAGQSNNTSYLVSQSTNQSSNINKLESLKNELDDSVSKFEQSKDIYEAELFTIVCREPELIDLLRLFYLLQSNFHKRMMDIIQNSMPAISLALDRSPRKFVFGTPLGEHVKLTGRSISPVIELCIYFLHSRGLREEGLFRISGSSVKIKKLKNGINALFLTLISLNDLKNDQQRQDGHSCITSLYELFKNAVGARPRNEQLLDNPLSPNSMLRSSLAVDEASVGPTNYTTNMMAQRLQNESEQIMDVHSIAGLLKLYLRELPEPLFTHALYDDWIECVNNKNDRQERSRCLSTVISKLPCVNFVNLKHLIKFLKKLSNFHEHNKMTSTNLAIAMAPSLIWPTPTVESERHADASATPENTITLNQQMCSFGLSASQHATLLEALIDDADALFPEPSIFEPPEFTNLEQKLSLPRSSNLERGRVVKSTSPTGMSETSSSSISSSASNSAQAATLVKGHSRKGGSMEGLLGGDEEKLRCVLQPNMSTRSIGRPASVHINRGDYISTTLRGQSMTSTPVPPKKPPIPTARLQVLSLSSSHKPPAPPVPPPTSIRHQQERLKLSAACKLFETTDGSADRPQPVSLRGTGRMDQTVSNQLNMRPSVPPPERPESATSSAKNDDREYPRISSRFRTVGVKSISHGRDVRGSESVNMREGRSTARSDSPILSSDGILANGDSSFDDSDDESWDKDSSGKNETVLDLHQATSDKEGHSEDPSSGTMKLNENIAHKTRGSMTQLRADRPESSAPYTPDAESDRGTSPKLTQSTPL